MISNHLAVFAFLTLITHAASQNGTLTPSSNCELAASLDAANATGSTAFPGILFDQSTGEITSTPLSNWSLIVSLTEINTSSTSKEGIINYRLDTSSTVGTNDTNLPYNACVIVWTGVSEPGDACLRPNCLEALTRQYQASARQIAEQMRQNNRAYIYEEDVCRNLLTTNAPEECETPSQRFSTALSLNPISAQNCTPSLPTTPEPLGGTNYLADSPTSFTAYDNLLSATSPFIIALWSNSTTMTALGFEDGGDPWADTRIGCVGLDTVNEGSRDPATAAGRRVSPWPPAALGGALSLVAVLGVNWAFF